MKTIISIGLLIAALVLVLVVASCGKPAENATEGLPSEIPGVDSSAPTLRAVAETPAPPLATDAPPAVLPVAGTVLRWIDYSDFVFVPGGTFMMGADSQLFTDFSPAHEVTVTGFWIQQAEVTNQQYAQCVAAGECTVPAVEEKEPYRYGDTLFANYPVVGVDWNQAEAYCTYINSRLPTEAEWELAARGNDSFSYPWGEDAPACDLLNFNNCLDPSEPEDVRSYNNGASPFEAMDMLGNVYEWVADWYQKDYYPSSPPVNPKGPDEGTERVFRGGGYKTPLNMTSPMLRFSAKPDSHNEEIGFRCVLLGTGPDGMPAGEAGSTSFYPPPCQVVSSARQGLVVGATMTPFPACEPASISAYCKLSGSSPICGINISQANCYYDNELSQIVGNSYILDCQYSGTNPRKYTCDPPPGSVQGSVVDISYCHLLPPNQPEHACPAGYAHSFGTTFCEPLGLWLPKQPCPNGYTEYGETDCLPMWDAWAVGCPAGFMALLSDEGTRCYPLNECLLADAPANCEKLVCPEGETYDPSNQCCAEPGPPPKMCPIGEAYDPVQDYCYVPDRWPDHCFYTNVTIPYCPTVTPTFTPTPEPELPPPDKNCSDYKDPSTCAANGCRWELTNFQGVILEMCVKP